MNRRCELVLAAVLAAVPACTITSEPMLRPTDAGADVPVLPDAPADAPRPDAGFACSPDALGCFGTVRYRCGADGRSREDEVTCPEACDVALGCVTCVPGSRRCTGTVSEVCVEDGSGWRFGRDCDDWGSACGVTGFCDDACAVAEAERSYLGCEYWPSPLANHASLEMGPFDFRVVVANPGGAPAEITITRGGRFVARETVPAGAAIDVAAPWIDGVSFAFDGAEGESHVAADGAYRLVSTRPVVVAQFNPFHYAFRGALSYSNDASLLFPSHALGSDYVGLSWLPLSIDAGPTRVISPGYLALVGVDPGGTEVSITLSSDVAPDAGGRWGAALRGETITFTLARGEIAQIAPALPPLCDSTRPGYVPAEDAGGWCEEPEFDLTGSRIVASRPIEAFGGHVCANAPVPVLACDHLETTLAPTRSWGTRFETAPLADPATDVPNVIRIVAAHDGTVLTIDPPVRGIEAGLVLDAGEHVDGMLEGPTSIAASRPIEVAQILLGQEVTDPAQERGDPGLTLLVPQEQFRSDYVFVTPTSYTVTVGGQSWLLVSREPGAPITLDGAAVEATWTRVGERELATVPVVGGAHRAVSTAPFGLIAFGLGQYTSYAYPAGLDLRVIPF